jgi:hypothetical protein
LAPASIISRTVSALRRPGYYRHIAIKSVHFIHVLGNVMATENHPPDRLALAQQRHAERATAGLPVRQNLWQSVFRVPSGCTGQSKGMPEMRAHSVSKSS